MDSNVSVLTCKLLTGQVSGDASSGTTSPLPAGSDEGFSQLGTDDDSAVEMTDDEAKDYPKVHGFAFTDSSGVDLEDFIQTTMRDNQKDRAFLLQLEKDFAAFLGDNRMSVLKYPPMSSYQRMLVHRVAAYFGLNHNVDSTGRSVLVEKLSYSRIPEKSFSFFLPAESPVNNFSPKLILRRKNAGPESESDQRASGADSRSKSVEEKAEEYKRARARIFNNYPHCNTSVNTSLAQPESRTSVECSAGSQSSSISVQVSGDDPGQPRRPGSKIVSVRFEGGPGSSAPPHSSLVVCRGDRGGTVQEVPPAPNHLRHHRLHHAAPPTAVVPGSYVFSPELSMHDLCRSLNRISVSDPFTNPSRSQYSHVSPVDRPSYGSQLYRPEGGYHHPAPGTAGYPAVLPHPNLLPASSTTYCDACPGHVTHVHQKHHDPYTVPSYPTTAHDTQLSHCTVAADTQGRAVEMAGLPLYINLYQHPHSVGCHPADPTVYQSSVSSEACNYYTQARNEPPPRQSQIAIMPRGVGSVVTLGFEVPQSSPQSWAPARVPTQQVASSINGPYDIRGPASCSWISPGQIPTSYKADVPARLIASEETRTQASGGIRRSLGPRTLSAGFIPHQAMSMANKPSIAANGNSFMASSMLAVDVTLTPRGGRPTAPPSGSGSISSAARAS